MFKTSMPRGSRLVNGARRQLSTFPALTAIRAQRTLQQAGLRAATPLYTQFLSSRRIPSRFYSAESAAERDDVDAEHDEPAGEPSDGLIRRFADLDQLGVHPTLITALTRGLGYEKMTDVQSRTINSALNGVDLVAQARTGTGKTLAFLVPVFQRLLAEKPELAERNGRMSASSQDIKAIIMSPTRELAEQIGVEAKKLAGVTGIQVSTAVGGTRKRDALMQMQRDGCHILVATPGRLKDLLSDHLAKVAAPDLKAFVLDEADRMLDDGFSDEVREILHLLPDKRKVERQTLLFSATIPKNVVQLAKALVRPDKFEFVQTIDPNEPLTHERIPQHVVACVGYENWYPTIVEIAMKAMAENAKNPESLPFKAIVFFSNTAPVEFAAQTFASTSLASQMPIIEIHSKLDQRQRTSAADTFRQESTGIMFSSDVTARGMDFPNVSHVIQVGLPPDREQYIHRIGRTGRAGKEGQGWLLLTQEELPEARARLTDLPLKANNSLEAAKHPIGRAEPSAAVQEYIDIVKRGYSQMRKSEFSGAYHALLGQRLGRNLRTAEICELLNNWAIYGLGYDTPPAVSSRTAMLRQISRVPGINIGNEDTSSRSSFGNNFGGGRGGFGGQGYGGRGGGLGARSGLYASDRRGGGGGYGGGGSFAGRDGFDNFGDRGVRSDRGDRYGGGSGFSGRGGSFRDAGNRGGAYGRGGRPDFGGRRRSSNFD